jgi:hypothetical protein
MSFSAVGATPSAPGRRTSGGTIGLRLKHLASVRTPPEQDALPFAGSFGGQRFKWLGQVRYS